MSLPLLTSSIPLPNTSCNRNGILHCAIDGREGDCPVLPSHSLPTATFPSHDPEGRMRIGIRRKDHREYQTSWNYRHLNNYGNMNPPRNVCRHFLIITTTMSGYSIHEDWNLWKEQYRVSNLLNLSSLEERRKHKCARWMTENFSTTVLTPPTYLLIDKLEMSEQLDGEGNKETKLLLETSICCLHSSEEGERLSQQGQRTLKHMFKKYIIIL